MEVAEVRMLECMSRLTLRDGIQNEDIRKGLRVANIEKKMKQNRFRWFEHMQR